MTYSTVAIGLLLLVPSVARAQMTYEERATLARDPIWQDRIAIAAQQQTVLAQGESPAVCCQISSQEVLVPGSRNLCTLTIPPGTPDAPAYVQDRSIQRHNARVRLAIDVVNDPILWAKRMSAMITSDTCVASSAFTDAELQAYMARAWDLWALSPELSAAPVAPPEPPAAFVPPVPPIAPLTTPTRQEQIKP